MAADSRVQVAVVTGGHAFDVPSFHRLFRAYDGIDAYIQHTDDFASSRPEVRSQYDAVVFYSMLVDGPVDEGLPGYAGKPKAALTELVHGHQGIFLLHHALLAYAHWPLWDELVGARGRRTDFQYFHDETLAIQPTGVQHPITAGLAPWQMIDETYIMAEPGADSQVLLTVDHPRSMHSLAWVRTVEGSRVFCLQSGHDNQTWQDAGFREVVRRGILWCAGRI